METQDFNNARTAIKQHDPMSYKRLVSLEYKRKTVELSAEKLIQKSVTNVGTDARTVTGTSSMDRTSVIRASIDNDSGLTYTRRSETRGIRDRN